jgi:predicted transcriptional regulator
MILTSDDIRRLRLSKGLTQAELAAKVEISQSYVARLENGSLDPKLSLVRKIVEVLTEGGSKVCSEIMTLAPVTVDARDTVLLAVSLMQRHGYSQLPVVRGTQLLGIITEWDVIRNLKHNLREISVQSVMSPGGTLIADENTSVDVIIPLFERYQAVLIMTQGRLQGIITKSDLLKLI